MIGREGNVLDKLNNYQAIQQEIDKSNIILVFVKSKKCAVCDALLPRIEKLAIDKNINSMQVLIEDVPEFSGQHCVFTAPTVLLFVSGKEVFRQSRFIVLEKLEEEINKYKQLL